MACLSQLVEMEFIHSFYQAMSPSFQSLKPGWCRFQREAGLGETNKKHKEKTVALPSGKRLHNYGKSPFFYG